MVTPKSPLLHHRSPDGAEGRPRAGGQRLVLPALAAGLTPSPGVLAHHGMDGATPGTALEGLLSGIAHPVIGADHFFFLLAVGMLLAFCPLRHRVQAIAALSAGLMTGVVVAASGMEIPLAYLLRILTLIGVGLLALATRTVGPWPMAGLVGFAAFFHGAAFANAIIGSETTPLLAYLAGLSVTGAGVVLAVGLLAGIIATGFDRDFPRRARRWTGIGAVAIGNLLLLLSFSSL